MAAVSEYISEKIRRDGSISFSKFMEAALYLPGHGYYTRPGRRVFGREGDFYTAAQLQPLFGMLIARIAAPFGGVFVDWGAGDEHMRPHVPNYVPVDVNRALPERFQGFVLANELFDAIPVDVFADGVERRVRLEGGRFVWDGPMMGAIREFAPSMEAMVKDLSRRMERGALLVIDYGYTERELLRFPRGTLMSYRRHMASEDVLDEPGERDITAHVDFDALRDCAAASGFEEERFTTLGPLLAGAAEGIAEGVLLQHRMQWKSLAIGMGETFRALLLKKRERGT